MLSRNQHSALSASAAEKSASRTVPRIRILKEQCCLQKGSLEPFCKQGRQGDLASVYAALRRFALRPLAHGETYFLREQAKDGFSVGSHQYVA